MAHTIALIVAAGRGLRAGGEIPKQYVDIAGKQVLAHTIEALSHHSRITEIIVVIHPDDQLLYEAAVEHCAQKLLPAVHGGETRQESVKKGLEAVAQQNADYVLIHDAARPFVDQDLIDRVIQSLSTHTVVLPAIPVTDTIKRVEAGRVIKTVDREQLYGAQTPQGFHTSTICDLHIRAAGELEFEFTDDTSLAEWAGLYVHIVEGSPYNQKLTTRRDMELASLILKKNAGNHIAMQKMTTCTGLGFDVHSFEAGDGVILCGVKIPFDRRLKGHSDADVAMHALTDAILGSVGEGDIGTHFPPSDARWKGAPSALFLAHAIGLVRAKGGEIVNVDLTIICERPKVGPHCANMKTELARIMEIPTTQISIKATTTEGLGFTGRGEGIAAQAIATIERPLPEKVSADV